MILQVGGGTVLENTTSCSYATVSNEAAEWMTVYILYCLTSPTKLGCQSLRTFFSANLARLKCGKESEKKTRVFLCVVFLQAGLPPIFIQQECYTPKQHLLFFRHAPNQRIIQLLESLDSLMEGWMKPWSLKGWSGSPKKLWVLVCLLFLLGGVQSSERLVLVFSVS